MSSSNSEETLDEFELKKCFNDLKPFCQLVLVDPTPQNLKNLSAVLSSTNKIIVNKLFQYIFIPFAVHISKKHDQLSSLILEHFLIFLKKCEITDINTFLDVYTLVVSQLQDSPLPGRVRVCSEELKIGVMKCTSQLIMSSSLAVRKTLLTRSYYSKLSVSIFIAGELAKEQYHTIRVEALKCIMLLIQLAPELEVDEELTSQLPDILMLMVPGIAKICLIVIKSNPVFNHQPVVIAVQLWSYFVANVMKEIPGDEEVLKFSLSPQEEPRRKPNIHDDFATTMRLMVRDKQWLSETDQQLAEVTRCVVFCEVHPHWKVRLALSTAIYHVLNSSAMTMPSSVGYLLESLIFLSQDEIDPVRELAKSYIIKLNQKCENPREKRLVDMVEGNMFSLLTRLPRILNGADSKAKEKEMTVLSGFVEILGTSHLPVFLSSQQHLQRFMHCLILAATPTTSDINLAQDIAIRDFSEKSLSMEASWRKLKMCSSKKFESSLLSLCFNLVKYADVEMLIHCFLDEYNNNIMNRLNIILLFVYFYTADVQGEDDPRKGLVKDIISAISGSSREGTLILMTQQSKSREDLQKDIVQVCLRGELVAKLALVAGPQIFHPLLFNCLYQILELAGSPFTLIATAGQKSLGVLASLYPDNKIETLLKENVDYLSHQVMFKLRHAISHPTVLSVLSVIMSHSSLATMSSIHEIVNDVLVQSCDSYQDINGSAYLQVFHTYLSCIHKWTVKPEVETKVTNPDKRDVDSLISELVDYQKALMAAKEPEEEPQNITPSEIGEAVLRGDGDPGVEEMPREEMKPPLPEHVHLTIEILKRSMHFLPANILHRQILVMEIIKIGVEILSGWKDELLPMVHKIWGPFVERLKYGKDPLLLQRAFSLLLTLASTSQDFIRDRVVKEVLERLCKILRGTAEDCLKEKNMTLVVHTFSQQYKLQCLLLSKLPSLAGHLSLRYIEANNLITSATPYLSSRLSTELQEKCITYYKELAVLYPHEVWAHLITFSPEPVCLNPPPRLSHFTTYKIARSVKFKEEYAVSVTRLLDEL